MLNSVTNALRMIDFLVEKGEGGVSEMARALELSPGAAYRLVSTLVAAGYADQDEHSKRYRPSTKILDLANTMRDHVEFLDLAKGHLYGLAQRAEETVNLGVLRGDHVTYVDRVVSNRPVAVEVQKGSVAPAYCTALGKVLLAFGDETKRSAYLESLTDLVAEPPRQVPRPDRFAKELETVLSRGYAEDKGEFSPEIRCVAAPILNSRAEAVAAVSVTGPYSRITEKIDSLVPMVEITAKELTLVLRGLGDDSALF